MNLKNKDIAEGMRVTNGKDKLRVISWDKSYTDCLLNYLDSRGTTYVVAQNYELSGTEKDPQISWMNGRWFTDYSDDDAFETYLDFLGEVHEHDISESLKKSTKSLKESAKPINEKNVAKFVDELNEWCDDNVHYIDADSARFTKKYGKLYDFKYNVDHSFGDADVIIVWDDQGTLNLFEDDFITEKIDEVAEKYGWYAEPYDSSSDFTFAEL
jgi:hypothetical protein